jgi:hypothetical protein
MLNKLSRRQFAGGLCACGLGVGHHAHAQSRASGGGCHLTPDEFQQWVAPTASEFAFVDSATSDSYGGPLGGSSGNRLFDQALAITLAKLSRTFDVLPAFAFFTEPKGHVNAYSSTEVTNRTRPDGTVAYGRNLLEEQMSDEQSGLAWVVGVCAHEFAHTVQRKRGTRRILVEMSGGSVFRNELHADFLAGYFSGLRKLEKPDFPAAELALGMYNFGDRNFGSKSHHGTPTQRGEAVRQGFKYAYERRANFEETFQAGFAFAKAQKLQN